MTPPFAAPWTRPASPRLQRERQRGAALLTAMIIVTLVATLTSAMVWQQWRAVQVEAAERGRAQSSWILVGALDWARLILKEDGRTSANLDHLGEPWAVPLAEARLSTFLAADKDNTDDGPEAFMSGAIADAQARYNLTNLLAPEAAGKAALETLKRLCEALGLQAETADRIAANMVRARAGGDPTAPLMPESVAQLTWLGIDADAVRLLTPYVVLLPPNTSQVRFPIPVNLNTAPREVLAAVIKGMDLASAERLVQARQRTPFRSVEDAQKEVAPLVLPGETLSVNSNFFEVRGRLRLGDRVLEQVSLVRRTSNTKVEVVHRERISRREQPAS